MQVRSATASPLYIDARIRGKLYKLINAEDLVDETFSFEFRHFEYPLCHN